MLLNCIGVGSKEVILQTLKIFLNLLIDWPLLAPMSKIVGVLSLLFSVIISLKINLIILSKSLCLTVFFAPKILYPKKIYD